MVRVLVRRSGPRTECHACHMEIAQNERYVRTAQNSFHTVHYTDGRGRAIVKPTTELERSRSTIPVRITVTGQRPPLNFSLEGRAR